MEAYRWISLLDTGKIKQIMIEIQLIENDYNIQMGGWGLNNVLPIKYSVLYL